MDLFDKEQKILDSASARAASVKNGMPYNIDEFETLADEYGKLLKQFRRITRFADRTAFDLFNSNADLSDKVLRDPLTGLYNRRYLEDKLAHNIKELSRASGKLSLLMLDIDFFKKFNDTYGHNEGDYCIKSVAEAFTGCVARENDFVARYGGEEFVIVLPYTDENGARLIAKRALDRVNERRIPHEKNECAGYVTVSAGVTTAYVKFNHNGEDYIKCADEALYMSKQNGRNRFTFKQFV